MWLTFTEEEDRHNLKGEHRDASANFVITVASVVFC